jgi:dTDP-4-amino-4,6-dideoxy-D-galactose acyltransferase
VTAPAELLPWDSEFFGARVARALGPDLPPGAGARLLDWCHAAGVDLLYLLANPQPPTIAEAERAGFGLMDVRIELAAPSAALVDAPGGEEQACREFRPADLASLRDLARSAHRDSRFFADGRIPPARAAELFVRWLERDCVPSSSRWAGVVDVGGAATGYVTATIDSDQVGRIGLLAVGEGARGRGLAQSLLRGAGRWFRDRRVAEVRVVTQGRNVPAQRVYQRAGFRTAALQLWYHRWFTR